MARDFGADRFDIDNMSDDELRDLVLDRLREQSNLGMDDIEVLVRDGRVVLSGRVGTDAEVEVADAVLDDVLDLDRFANDLVVDELNRGQEPAAADTANEEEIAAVDPLGGHPSQQSDTAEHLVEDLDAETHGTRDVSEAIRDASSYTPPERPVSDGYGSRENH